MGQKSIVVSNRRPVIVLTALVGAMTASSIVLLLLEPGPISMPPSMIDLRVSTPRDPALFDTVRAPDLQRWRAIVIYENGMPGATVESISDRDRSRGLRGLGYHFVVTDVRGGGTVQAGFRWRHQRDGAWATGPHSHWYNQHAISICLAGNSNLQAPSEAQMRDLIELIHRLQKQFGIPASHVRLQADTDGEVRPGRLFPIGHLRERLLMASH